MSNAAANATKKVVKHAVKTKLNLATLKIRLIIAAGLLIIFLLVVLIAGVASILNSVMLGESAATNDSVLGYGQAQVSPEVEQYRDAVSSELSKYGMTEYTDLVLALMMQESGGRGNDPMQASESKCGNIGCITNPSESIEYGVKHFVQVLKRANYDIKLTLQSYNFGGGFIDYVLDNGGSYTKELAISFSQMMYQKLAHTGIYVCHRPSAIEHNACYGDIEYVDAVLRYLPSAVIGNSDMLANGLSSPLSRELVVTSPFGWRNITGTPEFHRGIDFRGTYTDSVHSVQKGTVVYAGVMSTYGNLVQIQHDGFISAYAHLSKINVKLGDEVSAGQVIGMVGDTGRSYGTHLHFEIKTSMWDGHVNPATFLGL